MKKILFVVCLVSIIQLLSCGTPPEYVPEMSKDQHTIKNFMFRYETAKNNAPNEIIRSELKNRYMDSAKLILKDSLNYIIKNAKVRMTGIHLTPISSVKAFTAEFDGNDKNKYWLEIDFPNTVSDSAIHNNPAYKLLKDIPERSDTTLSLFWLGEVEWEDPYYSDALKIRVIPFPRDYNFDSSRKANATTVINKGGKHFLK